MNTQTSRELILNFNSFSSSQKKRNPGTCAGREDFEPVVSRLQKPKAVSHSLAKKTENRANVWAKSVTTIWPAKGNTLYFIAVLCASNYATAIELNDLGTSPFVFTENQISAGMAVQTVCGRMLPDRISGEGLAARDPQAPTLLARCGELVRTSRELNQVDDVSLEGNNLPGSTNSDLANALSEVIPEEFEIVQSVATEASTEQLKNVGRRLEAIRAGVMGLSVAGLNWNPSEVSRGGTAGSEDYARLGAFLTGVYGTGDREDSDNVAAFDFDTAGVTIGVDYRFSAAFVAGIAYSYTDSELDIGNNFGDIDVESNSATFYGTFYAENFYVEGFATFGTNDYTSSRNVDYNTNSGVRETLSSNTEGDQFTWGLSAGYNDNAGNWWYSYYLSTNAIDLTADGYTETTSNPNGGSLALIVNNQDIESLQAILGGQLSFSASTAIGVVKPYLDVAYHYEFEDGDEDPISAQYANDPFRDEDGHTLRVFTDAYDEDYFRITLGVSAVFQGGTQVFLNYDTVAGLEDITSNVITAGVRMEF